VGLGGAVGANEKPAAVVEPSEGALDDPALTPKTGAVCSLTACDDRLHTALPDEAPVLVVVVATVSDQHLRPPTRATDATTHRRHRIEQCE